MYPRKIIVLVLMVNLLNKNDICLVTIFNEDTINDDFFTAICFFPSVVSWCGIIEYLQ